jgi:hypothetical protein
MQLSSVATVTLPTTLLGGLATALYTLSDSSAAVAVGRRTVSTRTILAEIPEGIGLNSFGNISNERMIPETF